VGGGLAIKILKSKCIDMHDSVRVNLREIIWKDEQEVYIVMKMYTASK
jgi:hypothetical protein